MSCKDCTIPFSEVKRHSKKNNIWIVIENSVYDVSKFLKDHPGGEAVLVKWGGKDATNAFEDAGHSSDARILMRKYKVGVLPEEERKVFLAPCILSSKPSKTWRTYEGSPKRSRTKITTPKESKILDTKKSDTKPPSLIIVPKERCPRICMPEPDPPPPPSQSSWWKYLLLGLGAVLIAGFVAKKKMESG